MQRVYSYCRHFFYVQTLVNNVEQKDIFLKNITKVAKKRQVYSPARHMNKVGQIYEGVANEIFSL
jgi:hypothetical protein